VPDDKRFKNRPYLAEKKIFGLELGDLNGDKRADMVYYGDPKELVVVYQNEKGEWGRRRTFDITDFAQMPYALAVGDINGDAIVLRDFDGDRRLDLLYLSFSEDKPFAFRFQGRDGKLGPLVRCRTAPLRAVGIGDPTGDARQKILAVKTRSGRLVMYETRTEENGDRLLEGAVERYTLRSVKSPRPPAIAVGCFTQPGRLDFVVTAAEANEIEMFFQDATGHWSGRTSFPTLQNVTDVAPIDSDGDGRDDARCRSRANPTPSPSPTSTPTENLRSFTPPPKSGAARSTSSARTTVGASSRSSPSRSRRPAPTLTACACSI